MKRNRIVWAIAGVLVLAVVGGSMFFLGRVSGGSESEGQGRPMVQTPRPSQEERDLQKIKIAASETKIEEARLTADGWVVRVATESPDLDLMKLSEKAAKFFKELSRSGVDVYVTSFAVRTNDLKDVWGNQLRDVSLLWVGLDKETFKRVNWEGFNPENFPRITQDFWIHELVAEREREKQAQQRGEQGQGGSGGGESGSGGSSGQSAGSGGGGGS